MTEPNPTTPFNRSSFTPLIQNLVTEVQLVLQPTHSSLQHISLLHLATVQRDILKLILAWQNGIPHDTWTPGEQAGLKLLYHMRKMVETVTKIKEQWEEFGGLLKETGVQMLDAEGGVRTTERNEEVSGETFGGGSRRRERERRGRTEGVLEVDG